MKNAFSVFGEVRISSALLIAVLVVAGSWSTAFAQGTGTILGTVRDASGAAISGASVTATNLGTNFSRATMSDSSGNYAIPLLPVGSYQVNVTSKGFKAGTHPQVGVNVASESRVDFKLEIGTVNEQVTVSGEASAVQTDTASVGEVIENRQILQLPLNGRNFMQLTTLAAGMVDPPNDYRHSVQGIAPTANGARSEYNNVLFDGTSNTEHWNGNVSVVPPLDSIEQFKLQTANYSAEYGQGGGLVVNLVSKAGGNQLHGSAWDFLRNSVFDARNYFATSVPPLKRNQFGGTIGGPIWKNKTFFFFAYEGVRQRKGLTIVNKVPTALERAGDFSQSTGTMPTDPDTGMPYPDNVIPSDQIDPISAAILNQFVPLPNNPSDPSRNYIASPSAPLDSDIWSARVDQNFSTRDTLFVRISRTTSDGTTPKGFIGCCDVIDTLSAIQGTIGYTHSFSPSVINEFTFGGNRRRPLEYETSQGTDVAGELGILGANTADPAGTHFFLSFSVSGYTFPSSVSYSDSPLNTFVYDDKVSWVKGKHTVKFGAEFSAFQFKDLFAPAAPAGFTFSGLITGNGMADFLLGRPTSVSETYVQPFIDTRTKSFEAFVQDDWVVTPRLTLNLGARWTTQTPTQQHEHKDVFFDFDTGALIIPSSVDIGDFQFSTGIERTDRDTLLHTDNHIAPRVGLAFRPFNNNRTVIRAGYGMFTVMEQGNAGRQSATNPPFRINYSNTDNVNGLGYNVGRPPVEDVLEGLSNGFSPQFVDANFHNGYMQNWNLTIEHEILKDTVMSIGYVGSKGTDLSREYNINVATPGPGDLAPRRPYPQFSGLTFITNGGDSTYHSLQVRGERQFSSGLAFLASYTFSKALGDVSTFNQADFQNPNCLSCEKGRLYFDVRHRFVASFSYELPFGAGRRFMNTGGAANMILGGWGVSGIVTAQTGFPLTVTTKDNANSGGPNRPNLVGDPMPDHPTINQWLLRSAFEDNAPYTFGDSGRGIATSPGYTNVDFSVLKTFPIRESQMLEFHADAFNILNHPNFGFPNTQLQSSQFGVISSAGEPRDLQFGLKYRF